MRLYQAEWCPFSHRVRAKLTELGIDYEIVNFSRRVPRRRRNAYRHKPLARRSVAQAFEAVGTRPPRSTIHQKEGKG
jgi:glutaredoxin